MAFVDRILELMRFFTLQWWISRDHRFDESYIRNSFGINDSGERVSEVGSMMMAAARTGVEKVMSRATFETAVIHAGAERRAPVAIGAFCDALYSFEVGDDRRFVLEAAIACEILLNEPGTRIGAARNIPAGTVRRELGKRNFEDRLSFGLEAVVGRSFAADKPDANAWLESLWIARNNVAHGKPVITRHSGMTVRPDRKQVAAMAMAVIELFMWYQQFRPYQPVDGP